MISTIIQEDIDSIIKEDLPWEKFKGKTILITGANGFLPAYLSYVFIYLNKLKNYDIKLVLLCRNKERAELKFSQFLEDRNIQLLIHDVNQPISIEQGIDIVIHAASQASPRFYGVDPVGTINANIIGTSNLLQLAHQKKCEAFLYFSSSEVYGVSNMEGEPIAENDYGYMDPTNVRACYGEGKRAGETLCVSWMHQYGVPIKIVRPFHTYGPGMDLKDGRVYADFISDLVNNKDIEMKSDGLAVRAFCYLKDATLGFIYILLRGENGQAYNLGNINGRSSIIELAQKLVNLFPEKKIKLIKKEVSNQNYIKSLVNINIPNSTKLCDLGWNPTTIIETGFKRTVLSYTI
ncbi:MAG: NAD-dependent epimerase/dehydratase family protein [Bacteroidota bacterium]|nr:NAD-dependent epimerase/dehydratase family protein [Bacteroidota bacterium]